MRPCAVASFSIFPLRELHDLHRFIQGPQRARGPQAEKTWCGRLRAFEGVFIPGLGVCTPVGHASFERGPQARKLLLFFCEAARADAELEIGDKNRSAAPLSPDHPT